MKWDTEEIATLIENYSFKTKNELSIASNFLRTSFSFKKKKYDLKIFFSCSVETSSTTVLKWVSLGTSKIPKIF